MGERVIGDNFYRKHAAPTTFRYTIGWLLLTLLVWFGGGAVAVALGQISLWLGVPIGAAVAWAGVYSVARFLLS
jgi:hypothetical protein